MERVQEQTSSVEIAPEKAESDVPMVPESEMSEAEMPQDMPADVPANVPGKL